MSQPNPSGIASPVLDIGAVITTETVSTTETIQTVETIPTETVPTETVPTVGTIPAAQVAPGRSRAARLRQITVLGVFTSAAMVSVRMPAVVIVPVMIVVLAGIDIAGGIVAKSWALGRSPWAFAAGVLLFVLLFWVYGMSLRHGELSTITIGWVVLVTLADMGLDRFHYDVHFPLSKWIAALAAVGLLAYLLVGPNAAPDPARKTGPKHPPATTPTSAPGTTPTSPNVGSVTR